MDCEQREGEGKGKMKREPIRMTKDFDFQTLVIYVMYKLTNLGSKHIVILTFEPWLRTFSLAILVFRTRIKKASIGIFYIATAIFKKLNPDLLCFPGHRWLIKSFCTVLKTRIRLEGSRDKKGIH